MFDSIISNQNGSLKHFLTFFCMDQKQINYRFYSGLHKDNNSYENSQWSQAVNTKINIISLSWYINNHINCFHTCITCNKSHIWHTLCKYSASAVKPIRCSCWYEKNATVLWHGFVWRPFYCQTGNFGLLRSDSLVFMFSRLVSVYCLHLARRHCVRTDRIRDQTFVLPLLTGSAV